MILLDHSCNFAAFVSPRMPISISSLHSLRILANDFRGIIIIDGIPTTIRGKTVNDLVEHAIARALSAIDSADRISSAKKDADRTPTTFQGYTEHFLNEFKFGKRSGTYIKELRGYFSNYLLPFFGKTPLCQIRTCDIQQMLDSILSVKKPGHELCKKTKKDILAFLGMILDSAQEDGIVMNNPAKSKRLIIGGQAERIIPSWEEEEWTVLFYKVLPSLKLQQDRLFLLLDMFHGLRKSEIAALTWNNIDLEKGTINITTSVQWATVDGASNQGRIKEPKTQNGIREIVISQFVLPYLREANKSKTYLIYGTR